LHNNKWEETVRPLALVAALLLSTAAQAADITVFSPGIANGPL